MARQPRQLPQQHSAADWRAVHCPERHPDFPSQTCGAYLGDVPRGQLLRVRCWRCGKTSTLRG